MKAENTTPQHMKGALIVAENKGMTSYGRQFKNSIFPAALLSIPIERATRNIPSKTLSSEL